MTQLYDDGLFFSTFYYNLPSATLPGAKINIAG
jgi:hypothetical protein